MSNGYPIDAVVAKDFKVLKVVIVNTNGSVDEVG